MKVVLDTSVVLGEGQSSFRYFSELIPRLKQNSELSLEILPSPYFDLPKDWYPQNPAYKPLIPQAPWLPHGKLRSTLSQLKSSFEDYRKKKKLFKGIEPTVFHSFYYTVPADSRALLVTLALDTVFERLNEEIGSQEHFSSLRIAKSIAFKQAKKIISISDSTTRDLCEIYGIERKKIETIYLGVNPDFFFSADLALSKPQKKPYFLQVGGRLHHRNFTKLVEAFYLGKFKDSFDLVCVGEPWSNEEQQLLKRFEIEQNVVLIQNPPNIRLRALYQNAKMLVYPSLYEGFGFPLVEAMACGAPVVTSLNSGSIPEVAGNAALYFDPRNPADIARKIEEALDPLVAADLIKKGFENIKRFSWDETAKKTIEVYRNVLADF